MIIRQSAFNPEHKLLKGALHCHTTRSDGKGTPEEVISLHAQQGYDFMALTDHRYYNFQNFAPDVKMTIIPGMEYDAKYPEQGIHTYHVVCLGPEKGNGYAQDERMPCGGSVTCEADMQPYLDEIHRRNNLTFYPHPQWSNTPVREMENLKGFFAMELWNSGTAIEQHIDTDNGFYWDELLMQGKQIWGVATDDGHQMSHHCHGWVRVNAENNVDSILQALNTGAFYSSCGPVIEDFYIEDGVAQLRCSPCKYIWFRFGRFHPIQFEGTADRPELLAASFRVPEYYTYIRAYVMDEHGNKAWTNPIYLNADR